MNDLKDMIDNSIIDHLMKGIGFLSLCLKPQFPDSNVPTTTVNHCVITVSSQPGILHTVHRWAWSFGHIGLLILVSPLGQLNSNPRSWNMWTVNKTEYFSDFANGVDSLIAQPTTFKSDFAKKLQEMYLKEISVKDKKSIKISHVKTVIRLGGKQNVKDKTLPKRESFVTQVTLDMLNDSTPHFMSLSGVRCREKHY